jgi:hypothetical protein
MKVVTIARKPFSGSVTKNVLDHGCGALNIAASRVAYGKNEPDSGANYYRHRDQAMPKNRTNYFRGKDHVVVSVPHAIGRWPANVIFQHKQGCHQTGTVEGPGYVINRWDDGAKPFGGGAGHEFTSEQQPAETVAVWDCEEGCAVQELGAQSGASRGTGGAQTTEINRLNAVGTAARFFKQVQEDPCDNMVGDELWDYLCDLISPPMKIAPIILQDMTPECLELGDDEAWVHGIITAGDPTPVLDKIDRALKPGAFLLVLSTEEDLTGATAACALEDYGYEIRDAIAVYDKPDDFYYIAKSPKKERNAGVPKFKAEVTFERMFPLEGTDLEDLWDQIHEVVDDEKYLDNWLVEGIPVEDLPEDLLSLFEERVLVDIVEFRNNHPTVKPIAIMEALMGDLPKGSQLVDPFMGSGSTGMAALNMGMDFVGIEQDESYLKIAHHRVHHTDRATATWIAADIESDAEEEVEEKKSLMDFFGI